MDRGKSKENLELKKDQGSAIWRGKKFGV